MTTSIIVLYFAIGVVIVRLLVLVAPEAMREDKPSAFPFFLMCLWPLFAMTVAILLISQALIWRR